MKFYIGQYAEYTRTVTEQDVFAFAELSGDKNPMHLKTGGVIKSGSKILQGPICHGFLVASAISAVLGTQLPGPGTIYLNQTLSFHTPVFFGDIITAQVRVKDIREEKKILILDTRVVNQQDVCVISGEAVVKVQEE